MELEDLKDELRDRYGEIPEETENLLRIITLKIALGELKIAKLEQGAGNLVFTFLDHTPVQPEKILELVNTRKKKIRLTPEGKLIVKISDSSTESLFRETKKVLQALV